MSVGVQNWRRIIFTAPRIRNRRDLATSSGFPARRGSLVFACPKCGRASVFELLRGRRDNTEIHSVPTKIASKEYRTYWSPLGKYRYWSFPSASPAPASVSAPTRVMWFTRRRTVHREVRHSAPLEATAFATKYLAELSLAECQAEGKTRHRSSCCSVRGNRVWTLIYRVNYGGAPGG